MSKTNADIVVLFNSRNLTSLDEFEEFKEWLDLNCSEAMQIPFNREFIDAYGNEFMNNHRDKFPIWLGFDYQHEAMLFKLTWS